MRRTPQNLITFPDRDTGSAHFEVGTIADLRAIPVNQLKDGQAVQVLGYHTAGDGGGGLFRWSAASTATANGGTVFAPAFGAGMWQRVFSGAANVRWFGAQGDGVTNDILAFTKALAASLAVQMDEGEFYVGNSTVTLTRPGASLTGIGRKSIIVGDAATADGVVQVNGDSSSAYESHICLFGFCIEGNGTTGLLLRDVAEFQVTRVEVLDGGFTNGIELAGALTGNFYGCKAQMCTKGLHVIEGAFSSVNLVQFNSCHFHSNTKHAVHCIRGASLVFNECGFQGNGTPGQDESPLQFENMCTTGVQPGVVLTGCWFETNHSNDGELSFGGAGATAGISITQCGFYSTDVRYNVKLNLCLVSMFGNGVNPVLTVGTFGTDSFNVNFGANVRGLCWNNSTVKVAFDPVSYVCFQDQSGRLVGTVNWAPSGLATFFLDNANTASIGADGGDLYFKTIAGSKFRFNRSLYTEDTTEGGANAGAIRCNGGMFLGKDLAIFGKINKNVTAINITGSRGGNAALESLIAAFCSVVNATDSTTA